MLIAHVTATFPPYRGGTGNVAYQNALELIHRGHEVHVFTALSSNVDLEEFNSGIKIHRIKPIFRTGNAIFLPQLLSRLQGFDVIHLHYPFYGGEFVALASWLRQIPMVITYHQDVLLDGLLGLLEKLMRCSLEKMVLRQASRLLFTSQDYFQFSHARPLLGKSKELVKTLSNGVDINHFSPGLPPVDLSARLKPTPDTRIVLMVAALDHAHYFKGIDIFLKSLSGMPAWVTGVIVGDGELRSVYMRQARSLLLGNRVHFAGRVSDDVLPDYYRLADVTVLPSVTRGEAFGLVLLESLACATPVVATNLPGVRTVVDHGKDGYLAQPGDPMDLSEKLSHLLKLPAAQLRDFGWNGRKKVEQKYGWNVIGNQLVAIYQEILAQKHIGRLAKEKS